MKPCSLWILVVLTRLFQTALCCKTMKPIMLVHGGAGDIVDSRVFPKTIGIKKAARVGYEVLKKGGTCTDAVEAAVRCMEDDPAFNAGYGSVLNLDGEVEMDAAIMVGETLSLGGVTVVKDIAHPISLARLVMEKTPHVLLAGQGANKFAREQGIPTLPPGSLVTDSARKALEDFKKHGDNRTEIGEKTPSGVGTVGAVALDQYGNLAAATSTGGMNGKMVGRCSDTSQSGSGVYADNLYGAVSTTGHGDTICKYCVAHTIVSGIRYGKSASAATTDALQEMTARLTETAGAITISQSGEIGIDFTSNRMAWAYQIDNELHYGIEHGQDDKEIITD